MSSVEVKPAGLIQRLGEVSYKTQIYLTNGFALVVHVISIALLAVTMEEMFVDLDVTQSKFMADTEVLPPGIGKINDVIAYQEVHWITSNPFALFFVIEGFSVASAAYGLFKSPGSAKHETDAPHQIEGREVVRRWVDFGITLPFVTIATLISFGEHLFMIVACTWFLVFAQQAFGFLLDSEMGETGKTTLHKWVYIVAYGLIMLFTQFVVFVKVIETESEHDDLKWVIAILNLVYNLLFFGHLLTAAQQVETKGTSDPNLRIGSGYRSTFNRSLVFQWLGLCWKETMIWSVYSAVRHTIHELNPTQYEDKGVQWDQVFYVAPITAGGVLFIALFLISLGGNRRDLSKKAPPTIATRMVNFGHAFATQGRVDREYAQKNIAFDLHEATPVLGASYRDEDDEA
jgi:hypothetical protein